MKAYRLCFFLCLGLALLSAEALAIQAPSFELKDIQGHLVRSNDLLSANQILVVNFWEVGCKPCNELLPHLQDYADAYEKDGVKVVIISRDRALTQSQVAPFFTSNKYTFPVLLDSDQAVSRAFGVKASPATFVVSSEGKVILSHFGYRSGEEAEIRTVLSDLVQAAPESKAQLNAELVAKNDAREESRKQKEEWLKSALGSLRTRYDKFES